MHDVNILIKLSPGMSHNFDDYGELFDIVATTEIMNSKNYSLMSINSGLNPDTFDILGTNSAVSSCLNGDDKNDDMADKLGDDIKRLNKQME